MQQDLMRKHLRTCECTCRGCMHRAAAVLTTAAPPPAWQLPAATRIPIQAAAYLSILAHTRPRHHDHALRSALQPRRRSQAQGRRSRGAFSAPLPRSQLVVDDQELHAEIVGSNSLRPRLSCSLLLQVEGVGPSGTSGASCLIEKPGVEAPKMPMQSCSLAARPCSSAPPAQTAQEA